MFPDLNDGYSDTNNRNIFLSIINTIFVVVDKDQNREIDLNEFLQMMIPSTSEVVSKYGSIRRC